MLVNSETQQQSPKDHGNYAAQMLHVMAGIHTEISYDMFVTPVAMKLTKLKTAKGNTVDRIKAERWRR